MVWFKYTYFDLAVCDNTIDCAVLVRWHKQNKLAAFWAVHLNDVEEAINVVYEGCDGDVLFDIRGCNMAIENPGAILLKFAHKHFTLAGYEAVDLTIRKDLRNIFDDKDVSMLLLETEPVVKTKVVRQMRPVRKANIDVLDETATRVL